MLISRRTVSFGLAALPTIALGQAALPEGGVYTIVVPFPPGGSVDAIARLLQPGLQERLKASVIIENKSGASGSIGTGQVSRANPDGRTWLFVFDTHATNQHLMKLSFDPDKDLEPVTLIGTAPHVIATHRTRSYQSFADLADDARMRPGKISYATIGSGSLGHLTMESLSKRADVKLNHVPYRGGGPAMNDAIGGHVDLIIVSTAVIMPHLQSGDLRPLAQTGASRAPILANVPTVAEGGYPGFESHAWWGVFAPRGTPAPMVRQFADAIERTALDARIERQLRENQQVDLRLKGGADLRSFVQAQSDKWGKVIRYNGISAAP